MKKLLLIAAIMAAMSANAQKIRAIDKDGQPVPYASVMTTDSRFIGVTDIDGVLADVKGADTIAVSHVAYKPKLYKVNGKGGTITLEDADFGLPEVVVKKKPYVYVQTYYRMFIYTDEYGVAYYRVGLTDNVYDRSTKKLTANTRSASKALYGVIKLAINTLAGGSMDKISHLRMKAADDRFKKNSKYTIVQEGPNKKRIKDSKGTVGYIIDDKAAGERRFTYEIRKDHAQEAETNAKTKKQAKREKRAAMRKNERDNCYIVYRVDDEGHSAPEDFMTFQYTTSYEEEKEGKDEQTINSFQVFATDCAYVDKAELKERKKENKIKMTYQNIREFERLHKIPALSPTLQNKLNKLWKVGE